MTTKSTVKQRTKRTAKTAKASAPARATLAGIMSELEKAGSAQTRKTYARHGATGPMFGVSFATLKTLVRRIGVDHELGLALWDTGNLDARNLAAKVLDPTRVTGRELDRWLRETPAARIWSGYVPMLAAEGPHAKAKVAQWLESGEATTRAAGWVLLTQLALRDEATPDDAFAARLEQIAKTIHTVPNAERYSMNNAVIGIGSRSAALRKLALAAARRIGVVEVDHGDTDCKTPDAATYIEKAWAHARSKGFASPAAQERAREVPRLRC